MRNLVLLASIFGFVITSVWAGNCPQTHFSQAADAARVALGQQSMPRFTYIPADLEPGSEKHLCKMVADSLVKAADREDEMGFAGVDRKRLVNLLRCIDARVDNTELPRLSVAFIGDPRDARKAERIVEGWGAKFVFHSTSSFSEPSGDVMLAQQCEAGEVSS